LTGTAPRRKKSAFNLCCCTSVYQWTRPPEGKFPSQKTARIAENRYWWQLHTILTSQDTMIWGYLSPQVDFNRIVATIGIWSVSATVWVLYLPRFDWSVMSRDEITRDSKSSLEMRLWSKSQIREQFSNKEKWELPYYCLRVIDSCLC